MKKTSQLNKKCEGTFCTKKATRKMTVNGTGGWNEVHYFCVDCAKQLKKAK